MARNVFIRHVALGGGLALLVLGSMGLAACNRGEAPAESAAAPAPKVPAPRVISEQDWLAEKTKLMEMGKQFPTAQALYEHFLMLADSGTKHTRESVPDWSGWYTTAEPNSFNIDPDQKQGQPPTAKLTPKYDALLKERIRKAREERIAYDARLPNCLPPGFPRFIMEPWGREFIATPKQAWLISELGNEVHRVYTDGRGHIPAEDAQPSYDGDTIGFWDADALVAHTTHLTDGVFQVQQPDHTAGTEAVEIWRKVNDQDMVAYLWFYDSAVFVEPWFVRRTYRQDPNPDGFLRVRYYDCKGSPQNQVDEPADSPAKFVH